jgi:uncharacterized membrane-anchored protein YhcB (DUF1043 family)
MTILIFLLGSLLGVLIGALMCVRFVRQEVAGNLGPQLRQIQGQLNTIEAEVTYMVSSRYAELHAQLPHEPRR